MPLDAEQEARFWANVEKTEECWVWLPARDGKLYGVFKALGEKTAHRVSWVHHFGPIPRGMCVCHTCDNPVCIFPDHLFLGSHKDNMRDMSAKGRAKGGRCSVPDSQKLAEAVRSTRLARKTTQAQLARIVGCKQGMICQLETGASGVGQELAEKLRLWLSSGVGVGSAARGPYKSIAFAYFAGP